MIVVFFITLFAVAAIIIFAYMRNKQADYNDAKRQRLEDKTEELIQKLRHNSLQQKT